MPPLLQELLVSKHPVCLLCTLARGRLGQLVPNPPSAFLCSLASSVVGTDPLTRPQASGSSGLGLCNCHPPPSADQVRPSLAEATASSGHTLVPPFLSSPWEWSGTTLLPAGLVEVYLHMIHSVPPQPFITPAGTSLSLRPAVGVYSPAALQCGTHSRSVEGRFTV